MLLRCPTLDLWPLGWSRDCLQEWGSFSQIAIPSMLMHCLAWWVYELGGFLTGLISEVELGAQAIVYEIAAFVYMVISRGTISYQGFPGQFYFPLATHFGQ